MIEEKGYLIPRVEKVTLVSVVNSGVVGHSTMAESKISLIELRELLRTLGVQAGREFIQNKKEIDVRTFIGEGKVKEIAEEAKSEGSEALVFDFEISPSQMRNIKEMTELEVIDRSGVILEIFARHAQTSEAKIQIEISKLQYMLPRLSSLDDTYARQKGGIGIRSGSGEQKIELDRRKIRDRIMFFEKQLKEIEKSRSEQSKKRQEDAQLVALVGYTNAGKSSLLNRLCQENVLEENKLFATLDATYRILALDAKPAVVMIDTVGFISNLPTTLIKGFRSTLESAKEADVLLLVCDLSDENYEKHIEVSKQILEELGVSNKDIIIVFNKIDLVNPIDLKLRKVKHPEAFFVSSFSPSDMDFLKQGIQKYFLAKQSKIEVIVPYDKGAIHAQIMAQTNVLSSENRDEGIYYKISIHHETKFTQELNKFRMKDKQ